MALHRCASCGSPNVVTDTQTGEVSYNYKKGIVGTVVFGAAGAVAGIESKSQKVFKCQDCGITLTYEMPASLRNAIDLGLVSEDARGSLYAEGIGRLSWSALKMQYRNIEEGLVDRVIADREEDRKVGLMAYATATQEEFDNAVDVLVDVNRRLEVNRDSRGAIHDSDAFSDEKPMTLAEYYVFQDAVALFIENVAKFCPSLAAGKTDYRGLSKYSCNSILSLYIYEKMRMEYGRWSTFITYDIGYVSRDTIDLQNFLRSNLFAVYYIESFLRPTSRWYRGEEDRDNLFTKPVLSNTLFRALLGSGNYYRERAHYTFTGTNNKEISLSYYIPKYTVINGRLCYWKHSHNSPLLSYDMEYYFTCYPEKREEFDEKVAAHKEQFSKKDSLEAKLQDLKRTETRNNERIRMKKDEISRLYKKIFGRKAALKTAAELDQEIAKTNEENKRIAADISTINKELKSIRIVEDQEFYLQLVKEMDYFIVWRCVEEA